jgi:iron complex outermembrane recepter protein
MASLFRTAAASMLACALISVASAAAETGVIQVSIPAGPLPEGLQSLERQTGIELLFDRAVTSGFQTRTVRGELTTEGALRELLAQTDLTVRRARSGAWIVERPAAAPLAQPDAVIPEILVAGQRTQNADIRRFENDVQPYTIITRAELLSAHRDNVDQYFTSRVTSDTVVVPTGLAQDANTLSSIDLRGVGATLVLIDGRRMPGIPGGTAGAFGQADVNAIPLHAIKRIEVLTGAAGGIYGFGALGGVVNVVLDRESNGLDLYVTQGLSSRGDGHRQDVEARFGHTSADGATDFMAFAGLTEDNTLRVGDRNYAYRDRKATFELTSPNYDMYDYGNSVTVRSLFRFDPATGEIDPDPDLVLKPQFGGASLSSSRTVLPIGFSGDAPAVAASLRAHAGEKDLSVPDHDAKDDLGVNPRTSTLIANIRHRFSGGVEAYADALVLRSRGETLGENLPQGGFLSNGHALLGPASPANPFTDYVDVYFPVESVDQKIWNRMESSRYTGGLAADLLFDWRGTAEIGVGSFHRDYTFRGGTAGDAAVLFLLGAPSDLETNPLGNWDAFQEAISSHGTRLFSNSRASTRFRDQSLRLAGPVFSQRPHPTTLTLLAEHRTQDAPAASTYTTTTDLADGAVTSDVQRLNPNSNTTTSFYAELRSEWSDALELQLAIRKDREQDDFTNAWNDPESERLSVTFSGVTYTAGAKISPTPWLMFRGSYATGEQPPTSDALISMEPLDFDFAYLPDPRRGGTSVGENGPYRVALGGRTDLKTIRARTLFLGAVVTPTGPDGPRFAFDFSRIRRTRDVFGLSIEDVLAHEDAWPERVTRAPLTAADRASGFTAGAVTAIDTRYSNGASLEVDALDLHASWPLLFLGGRLRLHAEATWYMHKLQKSPFQPDVQYAGYRDGPLAWRANGGFDWSTERLTLGANLQYFDSYSVLQQGLLSGSNDFNVQIQGSRSIPSQSYLDLHATYHLPAEYLAGLTVDFGIVNALDKAPPRESAFVFGSPGYSRYGDPRRRRFELGLSFHF